MAAKTSSTRCACSSSRVANARHPNAPTERTLLHPREKPLFAFVLYALVVWYLAARFRRRLGGFLWVGAGLLGVALTGYFHYWLNIITQGVIALPVLQSLLWPYAALVAGVGFYIALLPRVPDPCVACGHDLNATGFKPSVCPNCHHARPLRCMGHKCSACTYDLSGQDLNHGVCPECGTPYHSRRLPQVSHHPDQPPREVEVPVPHTVTPSRRRELLTDLSASHAPPPARPS